MFKMYEDRASKLHGGDTEYKLDVQRKRKKNFYDEPQDELNFCGRKHFLINTFKNFASCVYIQWKYN